VNGIEAPLAGLIDVSLTYFPRDLMQPPLERLNFCGAHPGQLSVVLSALPPRRVSYQLSPSSVLILGAFTAQ
jgi:hypothetical protein